ncbi:zinc transporter ZntB [Roseovarius sp. SCSIO 43702]|uniref:zinc transporter ZntB n=1 Tax=Roseovarius sp. SCSIO 43702 TaxID=2823043 RepID=UPI001C72C098|nr:zinc transporter ZntB [Roseovarius sp. SCSIO 43702]QYX55291.1 zinc transporter ZntB [Roseovarius sp. SCSIO 43702]
MVARPEPICAFDVTAEGRTRPVEDEGVVAAEGAAYRWLHFDVGVAGLEPWLRAHLPETAVDALLAPETRPRCDPHGTGAMVNLRGVNLNPGADPEDMVSLRLWVTPGLLVTARVRRIWAVDAVREDAATGRAPGSSGELVARIAEGLVRRIEAVVSESEAEADALEDMMLEGRALPLERLAEARHEAIKLRRFIRPQSEALDALADGVAGEVTNPDALILLREVEDRSARGLEALDALRDRYAAMQDHLDAQRALEMGRNGYILSVVAAIFLPLGFLTGLFGVNVAGMPGVGEENAFWILCAASAGLGVVLFLAFKLGRWL